MLTAKSLLNPNLTPDDSDTGKGCHLGVGADNGEVFADSLRDEGTVEGVVVLELEVFECVDALKWTKLNRSACSHI
jgi:hypothetical protein